MAQGHRRLIAYFTGLIVVSLPLVAALSMAQSSNDEPSQHTTLQKPDEETQKQIDECLGCHAPDAEGGPAVKGDHLLKSPHAALGCTSCHSSITEVPHTAEMTASKPACADCHSEQAEQHGKSVHSGKDKAPGDHPTCVTCHGSGDPHSVSLIGAWTRESRVKVCSSCHSQKKIMARYGVNEEAVSSFNHSFHGRALLKFGSQSTAICIDCHGYHGVNSSQNPQAATHKDNVQKTCAKCHPGATKSFATSGSSHMDLTISRDALLVGVLNFFKALVVGMSSFLVMGVLLDLKRAIFSKDPPRAGKFVTVLVSIGFLSAVAAILTAVFDWQGGRIAALSAVVLLGSSVLIHRLKNGRQPRTKGRDFDRLGPGLRAQHVVLVVSFTLLVLTGIPIRNPEIELLRQFYLSIGGLEVGRVIHRIAGAVLILLFLYHLGELIYKWGRNGFKLSSWTMMPTITDIKDFITESRSYLGQKVQKPDFGRFTFRNKMDYFAVYWGIPIMGLTGLVLWFPTWFSSFLPSGTVPLAYIAHSDEAVLALIAIMIWHLYNSFFNPNHFAAAAPWTVGYMSKEDMEHMHPGELKQLLADKAAAEMAQEAGTEPEKDADVDGAAVEEMERTEGKSEGQDPDAKPQ